MKTILIVEDQTDVQQLLRFSLQSDDRRILPAYDAEEAWVLLASEQPDVVLLDIMMPGEMDGMDLLRKMRQRDELAETRVIVVSALAQNSDKQAAMAAGADDYLCKPFSLEELKQKLAKFSV